MALDPVQLVMDQLEPVLTLDPGLAEAIPRQVEAQGALTRRYTAADPEALAVYVAIMATQGLIPRLLMVFAKRIESAKGGPAEVKFQKGIDFLTALQKEMPAQAKQALREIAGEDLNQDNPTTKLARNRVSL